MNQSGNLLLPACCNLQATSSTWWKLACKWIPTNTSWLHNTKSMAMKWAFPGTYCSILHLYHQKVSSINDFSSNDDWSTQNRKITKANHRDAIFNKLFDVVKKNSNKANNHSSRLGWRQGKPTINMPSKHKKESIPNQKHESNC
jgi:hypothetical protein